MPLGTRRYKHTHTYKQTARLLYSILGFYRQIQPNDGDARHDKSKAPAVELNSFDPAYAQKCICLLLWMHLAEKIQFGRATEWSSPCGLIGSLAHLLVRKS